MAPKKMLSDGQIIKHDGENLRIEKNLSSGLTGEVYKGLLHLPGKIKPVDVAVKAMKALDFPLARKLFDQEGETLAVLMHLEEETKDSLADNLKIAPVYYGLSEYKPDFDSDGFPYLVMEFINGEKVQDLLKKQERLSEKQALIIAWHLFRVLDILHTHLLKTFIDLKFENLWWVQDDGKWKGQLKLTDFGTLEDIKPGDKKRRGVARDVLLGGVYFLRLLSGYTLEYSVGELKELARPVIKRFENETTWGTRRLLQKLLHRNIDARYKNAADVLVDLRQLVNFWSQPADRLVDMAQKNLALAENAAEEAKASKKPLSDAGLAAAGRAYSALDILRIKEPRLYDESDIQRAKNVLTIGDYFERGFALLQGRSFTLAKQTFEEGARSSDDPAFFRRWVYVAQIGEEIAPEDFETRFGQELKPILETVNSINSDSPEQWTAITKSLKKLTDKNEDSETKQIRPSLASKGLSYLIKECRFFETFSQAEKEFRNLEFGAAASSFDLAWKTLYQDEEDLVRFPSETVRQIEDETGIIAIRELSSSLKVDNQDSLMLYKKAAESLASGELPEAVESAIKAYRLDRSAPFRFTELTKLSLTALELGSHQPKEMDHYIRASRQFADIGSKEFGGKDSTVAYNNVSNASVQLELAIRDISNSDPVGFCTKLADIHALLGENGALVEAIAVFAGSRVVRQPVFLNALADSIEILIPASPYPLQWRDEASKVVKEQSTSYHRIIDDLMRQVNYILLPIMPDANKPKALADILRMSAEYADVPGGLDLIDLQGCLERLEKAKILLDKIIKLSEGEKEHRQTEIDALNLAVEDALESARAVGAKQKHVQDSERRARIVALSEERFKIQDQFDKLKSASAWDINPDLQKALYSDLYKKMVNFRIRCYQTSAGDPEGLRESIHRQKTLQDIGQDEHVVVDVAVLDIFINWTNRCLDMLGGEGWKQLSELANERKEKIEAEFKQTSESFAEGNLGLVQATLDHAQTKANTAPEWRELKAQFSQARAWNAWCESRSELFQSAKADALLLRDLRSFTGLNLPAIYWKNSPCSQYLDQTVEALNTELQVSINVSNVHNADFIETLRSSLDVAWTKRLSVPSEERSDWRMREWLLGAYNLRKDVSGLVKYVSQTLPPENVDEALSSFNYSDWDDIHRTEKTRHQQAQATPRLTLYAGIGLAACLVLSVVGLVGYRINSELVNQFLLGTSSPAPTLTVTPIPTPTLAPTSTSAPTETLIPTPVPQSRFAFSDPGVVYPRPPLVDGAYWLINETDTILVPPLGAPDSNWKEGASTDADAKGETFVYTESGNTSIQWIMDTPFEFSGDYEIYILDTRQFSSQTRTFSVLLDQQPVLPYRGTNEVIFRGKEQVSDKWLALGVYRINAGQSLTVEIALEQLTKDAPFAIDRLLIVRLNEPTRQMIDLLPSGRTLVSMLDDADVRFFEVVGGTEPIQVKDRGLSFTDVLAWNGSLSSRNLEKAVTFPIWVDWNPENRLAAGTYEVYVWIPAQHATVITEYFLLADGKVVKRSNPAQVNQKDHSGTWLSLGTWDLSNDAAVSLRMVVAPGTTGEIGVDAVAIVSVK